MEKNKQYVLAVLEVEGQTGEQTFCKNGTESSAVPISNSKLIELSPELCAAIVDNWDKFAQSPEYPLIQWVNEVHGMLKQQDAAAAASGSGQAPDVPHVIVGDQQPISEADNERAKPFKPTFPEPKPNILPPTATPWKGDDRDPKTLNELFKKIEAAKKGVDPTFVKNDNGKLRYDLMPILAEEEIVAVLTYGAKKYSDNNWAKGTNFGRYYAATMRHMKAFWKGEDKDPETGLLHLAHAACCVIFLLHYMKAGVGYDDRPRPENGFGTKPAIDKGTK